MAWTCLLIAGLLEIGWAIGLKHSNGFSKPVPSALTILTMIFSFLLLARALRELPVGTAYAVWTGIGIVGTTLLGMWIFGEPRDALRLVFIGLILIGIAGLKLFAPTS